MQKILIITVGNRQIGWQCQDGQIRCLSTTAKPATPEADPVARLYTELAATRPPGNYVVRHLGELLYHQCQGTQDFSPVQLLMDQQIIEDLVNDQLDTIWLVATDQSDARYQAGDTLWLAKLMTGKIQQTWPHLHLQTWLLPCNPTDTEAICDYYSTTLLDCLAKATTTQPDLNLYLQTKGSTPQMTSGLEICAVTLSRGLQVLRIIPEEPNKDSLDGIAFFSSNFKSPQPLSQYFLPIEKPKIISAWERGDFGEAKVWLESHKIKYAAIYQLADLLASSTHQDLRAVLKQLNKTWLNPQHNKQLNDGVSAQDLSLWKGYRSLKPSKKSADSIWESSFLIPIYSRADRWTDAFFIMAQTLERLLHRLYSRDKWQDQINEDQTPWIVLVKNSEGKFHKPTFQDLLGVWAKHYGQAAYETAFKTIRNKRNNIAHDAAAVSPNDLEPAWQKVGWPIAPREQMLLAPLKPIAQQLNLPDHPLLGLLYDWGLEQLRA